MAWLAKKMEIDNLVWFVGEQAHLKKWLDGFDIFVAAGKFLRLSDLETILKVMAAGLPIVGPDNIGLEDMVCEDEQDGRADLLINFNSGEALASRIIKLYKDRRLRMELGHKNRKRAEKCFTIERQVGEFEKIL